MNNLTFLTDTPRGVADYIVIHELATLLKDYDPFTDEKVMKAMQRIVKYYLSAPEYEQFKLWLKEE